MASAVARRRPRAEWERRILESALETFGREGYGVSVNRIIEEAGVPVGTFYRLFPDKDALFARLMADLHPAYVERITETVGDVSDPLERLRATIEAMIVIGIREYGGVARLYFTDVRGRGSAADVARRGDAAELELLTGPLRDGWGTGALACADVELVALGILGLARTTVEAYVLGRSRPSVAVAARQAASLTIDGLAVR